MLTYRNHSFRLDCFNNKRIYTILSSNSESQKTDSIISYYLSNRRNFFSEDLLEFFSFAEIDAQKENEIFYCKIDADKIIIEGWYDIAGRIISTEYFSFYWDNDFGTTNVYFRNNIKNAIREEFTNIETFRVDFCIVISGLELTMI